MNNNPWQLFPIHETTVNAKCAKIQRKRYILFLKILKSTFLASVYNNLKSSTLEFKNNLYSTVPM